MERQIGRTWDKCTAFGTLGTLRIPIKLLKSATGKYRRAFYV
jgi:hypothetical protein